MPVTNAEVAERLREMALFLDMRGVAFKPRVYEKAADAVNALDRPLAQLFADGGVKALGEIPHVGAGIAERIGELIERGHTADLDAMRAETPVDILGLTALEGVGPKMVKLLYDELGVRTLADLERAARAGRVRTLPHSGEKTEQKILKGLELLAQRSGRQPLGTVLDLAQDIERRLAAMPTVRQAAVAGSVRRRRETIGDLDFLVVASKPEAVMRAFVALPEVAHVYGTGPTKTMVRLHTGMDADLRVVPAASFGAALHYFTGSKDHNVALRRLAIERGLKLNEYGVFKGERAIAGRTEAEVYKALGLPYIPPELPWPSSTSSGSPRRRLLPSDGADARQARADRARHRRRDRGRQTHRHRAGDRRPPRAPGPQGRARAQGRRRRRAAGDRQRRARGGASPLPGRLRHRGGPPRVGHREGRHQHPAGRGLPRPPEGEET